MEKMNPSIDEKIAIISVGIASKINKSFSEYLKIVKVKKDVLFTK